MLACIGTVIHLVIGMCWISNYLCPHAVYEVLPGKSMGMGNPWITNLGCHHGYLLGMGAGWLLEAHCLHQIHQHHQDPPVSKLPL